jgi:hypothetical protein
MKLPNSRCLELSRRQTSCFTFCNGGGFRFGIFDTCPGKKLIYTRRDRREFLSQHVGTVCVFINFFRSCFFLGNLFLVVLPRFGESNSTGNRTWEDVA